MSRNDDMDLNGFQEVALYPVFTIEETLRYFGRIHGMTKKEIKDRTEFLIEFLGLPPGNRRVDSLSSCSRSNFTLRVLPLIPISGGQQRRVSLSAALLQNPKLLILDEPTVGVDPLLRHNIWCHLVRLAKENGTTVIITTHYIEEARQAQKVGLMRNGYLLAEAHPEALLAAHNMSTLEEVFLKLCQSVKGLRQPLTSETKMFPLPVNNHSNIVFNAPSRERTLPPGSLTKYHGVSTREFRLMSVWTTEESKLGKPKGGAYTLEREATETRKGKTKSRSFSGLENPNFIPVEEPHANGDMTFHQKHKRGRRRNYFVPSSASLRALLVKNIISMVRNMGALLFQMVLPPLQVILFCLTIGSDPKNLHVSVVNNESPFGNCSFGEFSCDFLHTMDPNIVIQGNLKR
ncbi:unnamed protein product [Darwinula stevensoni]|uniref:ABC transporter domain-containing protein n=1 Tax=Darwinula stevensoni TaxID=69355 RepID=A0A7R9A9C5_9CRUS|nr:unnamed protein product [Darwinula stevensoni]CAG0897220.1 unnamed protein product [Darwinula stevensoni]